MAILDVKGISVALGDPPRKILSGIDLSLTPGSITLLLGSNGSGKSVLLRTLLGLIRPAAGEIFLHGQRLSGTFREVHRISGVVFQNPDQQLFGATVEEDLAIGTKNGEPPDRDTLEELGVLDLLPRAPGELSGGQRRRVAVAGAVVSRPELLFLDEPFIELDYPAIQKLLFRLESMRNEGCTIILASHESWDIWPLIDRLILLHEGRILFQGDPEMGRSLISPEYGLRPPAGAHQ